VKLKIIINVVTATGKFKFVQKEDIVQCGIGADTHNLINIKQIVLKVIITEEHAELHKNIMGFAVIIMINIIKTLLMVLVVRKIHKIVIQVCNHINQIVIKVKRIIQVIHQAQVVNHLQILVKIDVEVQLEYVSVIHYVQNKKTAAMIRLVSVEQVIWIVCKRMEYIKITCHNVNAIKILVTCLTCIVIRLIVIAFKKIQQKYL
jgi:hypothetical protein